ncbi:MAG: hypothetical protein ACR2PI_19760 [Hyphomicrobiaceae bacterium]
MQRSPALLAAAAATLLYGCASVEDRILEYQHLSCVELDQKIGKYRYIREEAQRDGLVSDIVGVVGNKKQRDEADVDGILADVDEHTANTDLAALRTVKREKHCE